MSIVEELRRTVFGEGSDFLDKLVAGESKAEFLFLELLADDVTKVLPNESVQPIISKRHCCKRNKRCHFQILNQETWRLGRLDFTN